MTTMREDLNGNQESRWNADMLWKLALTIVAVLSCASLAGSVYLITEVADNQSNTNQALCTFHDDLGDRIAQTRQFLAHPETAPSFNDKQTLSLIAQQLDNQIRTYQSLKGLDCQQDVTTHTPSTPPGAILAP